MVGIRRLFQKVRQPQRTVIVHNGHTIVIERGWWRTRLYFDDTEMYLVSKDSEYYPAEWRFAYIAQEGRKKVTYSVLVASRFRGHSIKVEMFNGDSLMQWHDEIGELIFRQ